jgi:hypothetical protein
MGLDMYLEAEKYLADYNETQKEQGKRFSQDFPELGGSPIKELTAVIGYWRKMNPIHNWFVKNVQEGKDDCDRYYISQSQLKNLRDACYEVLKSSHEADHKLSATNDLFLGNNEYTEQYYEELERTLKIIETALNAMSKGWSICYWSSW